VLCCADPPCQDPPEVQLKFFPELASLSPAQYSQLLSKFHYTDDLTFHEFLSSIGRVISK
jgi:hypothetical protein